ncbi:MAG: YitT family protein [Defluviitaleaceae bacterium]|nr:YitT family protein [Defluviitaleaceae bacterium]
MNILSKIFPKAVCEYIVITLGVFLFALSIALFFNPHSLVTGGVSGLSVIFYDLSQRWWGFAVPLWVTNLALNVPILALAAKVFGLRSIAKTLYAMFALTGALYLADFLPPFLVDDLLLVVVFGSIISGAGISLVLLSMATTGGTAALASLINMKVRHLSIAKIMFVLDAAVVTLGLITFNIERTLYAIISIYITTKIIDAILDGLHFAKAVFIISEKAEAVAAVIMERLDRGVTSLHGEGMYSRNPKNVLMCIVSNKEIVELKDIVHSADTGAFVVVADVREVLGEGFKVMK